MADPVPIQRLSPGTAKRSRLYHWQFGVTENSFPADVGTARRLADGDLTPCEAAVLEIILNREGDISQPELQATLSARMSVSRPTVYTAAQRLAKHGSIGRKKVGHQWHYAKPGYSWRAAAKRREEV